MAIRDGKACSIQEAPWTEEEGIPIHMSNSAPL